MPLYLQTLLLSKSAFLPFATDELRQAAKAVADVTLSNHLVEVVFALFDENSELTPVL